MLLLCLFKTLMQGSYTDIDLAHFASKIVFIFFCMGIAWLDGKSSACKTKQEEV